MARASSGRNCLELLRLVWEKIGKIAAGQTPESLETLITKHAPKDKLGTIQPFKAKLQVKQNATPRFFEPQSVPIVIKGAFKTELDRLEAAGTSKK